MSHFIRVQIITDLLSTAWDRINLIIGILEWIKPVHLAFTLGPYLRVLGPGSHYSESLRIKFRINHVISMTRKQNMHMCKHAEEIGVNKIY